MNLRRLWRHGLLSVGMLAMALGTMACGKRAVDQDEVATQIGRQLEAEVVRPIDAVECPEDLRAEVGESIRCELTTGPDTLGVTATVTEVNGDTVHFDIQVDEAPA